MTKRLFLLLEEIKSNIRQKFELSALFNVFINAIDFGFC